MAQSDIKASLSRNHPNDQQLKRCGREDFQDLSRAPEKYCKGLSGLGEDHSYLAPSSTYNSAAISIKKPPPNPAIPATQESETGGSEIQSQPGQIIESLSRGKKRLRP